jgi:hypothetical protein
MASTRQLEANRANAKRSTGPRSEGGKARSRLNSRKHGLTAKTLIIVGENADDFDQLRADLMDEYDPQSALECELVERIAGILWRLRRVPFFEAAIMDVSHWRVTKGSYVDPAEEEDEEEADWKASIDFGRALIDYAIDSNALGKLANGTRQCCGMRSRRHCRRCFCFRTSGATRRVSQWCLKQLHFRPQLEDACGGNSWLRLEAHPASS